jgi:hypothetical protein
MRINGIQVGSGTISPSGGNNLTFTGLQSLQNAVNNLTGTITVTITLSGGTHSASGSFRFDNFILNGYVQQLITNPSTVKDYRYKFNGKEVDNETYGQGEGLQYGLWVCGVMSQGWGGSYLSVISLIQAITHGSKHLISLPVIIAHLGNRLWMD